MVGRPKQIDLNQSRVLGGRIISHMDWKSICSAPFDRDLELAILNYDGAHALVFPCRRILGGWINAQTKERVDVRPSHWREWDNTR
jgi:hypothetical protein